MVVLNGSSSAGTSSLAAAFQAREAARGRAWVITGIDDFLGRLPIEFVGVPDERGPYCDQGFSMQRDAAALISITFGPLGLALMRGYRRSVAALAAAGLSVLVDEVVLDEAAWDDWVEALAGVDAS